MTEAQKMLMEIKPAIREIFWISQCYNDHNFSERDLIDKCAKISRCIIGKDIKPRDVDKCNEWLDRAEKAINSEEK